MTSTTMPWRKLEYVRLPGRPIMISYWHLEALSLHSSFPINILLIPITKSMLYVALAIIPRMHLLVDSVGYLFNLPMMAVPIRKCTIVLWYSLQYHLIETIVRASQYKCWVELSKVYIHTYSYHNAAIRIRTCTFYSYAP